MSSFLGPIKCSTLAAIASIETLAQHALGEDRGAVGLDKILQSAGHLDVSLPPHVDLLAIKDFFDFPWFQRTALDKRTARQ